MRTAEAVLCGAGIAGVSAAYHLTVRHGLRDVVLVDDQPPTRGAALFPGRK